MSLRDTDLLAVERDGRRYRTPASDLKGYASAAVDLVPRFQAAEPIGGHRVVYVGADDRARLANPAEAATMSPAGVSVHAVAAGGLVSVRSAGTMEEASWDWDPGPIYLGPAGTLVQQPPESGSIYQVGVSIGPKRLRFIPLLVAQLN